MKFGQLIEYKWEKVFLENHTQNMVEKLFPDPFPKSQNWAYFWINSLGFIQPDLLHAKLRAIEI